MALAQQNGIIALEGTLDMTRCAGLAAPLAEACAAASVVLDLAGVGAADSAALALCLHAQRTASAHGHRLTVARAPASLKSLARLYGAEALLHWEN